MVAQFNPKVSNFKGKLHPDLIEEIQSLKISDIATKWGIAIKKRGAGFVTSCPFHKEKTPSLSLTDGAGFHCFGCGEKGGNIKFISKLENCSTTEASIMIAETFNLNIKVEDGNSDRHFHLKSVKPKYQKRVDAVTVKLARLESPAADSPQAEIASEVRAAIKKELEATEVEQIVYHYSRTQRVYRYQNPETGRKTFRQWSHKPDGGNSWGKGDQPWLAYRLKEASEALATGGNALLVQEGEKCVEIARGIGLVNITFQGSCWDEKDIRRSLGGLLVSCPDLILVVLTDTGDAGEKKGKILKATARSMGLRVVAISADQLVEDLQNNSDIEQVLARLSPGQFIEQLEKLAAETISNGGSGNEPPSDDGGSGDGGDDDNFDEAVALAQKLEEARAVIGNRIKFNELTQYYELDGEILKFDDLRLTLATTFNLDLKIGKASIGREDLQSIVRAIGDEHKFHPIRQYLNDCHQKYSDKSILEKISDRYFGTSNPLYNTFIKKFLIGCVARIFDPGCKLDTSLILQSPQQGLFKSTFFEELVGQDWYCNDMGGLGQKDEVLKLHMNWLIEWAELETIFTRKDNSQVKSFLSTRQDLIRPPYGRTTERRPRHSVIVGTTNQSEFLSDPTGHRRFWVVPVAKHIPIDLLRQERDLIWGAATACYLAGEHWWLTPVEDEASATNNKFFEIGSAWEDELKSILEGREKISTRELLVLLGVSLQDFQLVKKTEGALKFGMVRLGWKPCRVWDSGQRVRGYESSNLVDSIGGPSSRPSSVETPSPSQLDEKWTAWTANSNAEFENQNQKIDQSSENNLKENAVHTVHLTKNPLTEPISEVDGPPLQGRPVPSTKTPDHYISFGYTSAELKTGKKTVTRRSWKTNYVQKILNRFDQGLTIYPAFDCDPNKYPEAQQLGWVRLTQKPYQERLIDMPESDLIAEGKMVDTKEAFINKYFKGEAQKSVWVIRFEFIPFIADSRDFMPVGHYESTPAYKCAQKWVHDTRQGILSLSEAFERWNYLRDVEKAIVCRAIGDEHPQVMEALKRVTEINY